jgi:DNA (cytosine-5)-methyltransferase 1
VTGNDDDGERLRSAMSAPLPTSELSSGVAGHSFAASNCSASVEYTHLDLFTGIGGFSLAAEWTGKIRTIGHAEIREWQSKLLAQQFPDIPNYGDVRNIKGIRADIITGGFPCQPFSLAGKRRGQSDDRYLWPEMLRIIGESGAEWVLGENVPGINDLALDQVLSDLESLGYSAWPFEIPAAAVDSDQLRFRVWILAHHHGQRRERRGAQAMGGQQGLSRRENVRGTPDIVRRPDIHTPKLCGRTNGVSERLDAIGNAIVPQIAFRFFQWMLECSDARTQNAEVSDGCRRQ